MTSTRHPRSETGHKAIAPSGVTLRDRCPLWENGVHFRYNREKSSLCPLLGACVERWSLNVLTEVTITGPGVSKVICVRRSRSASQQHLMLVGGQGHMCVADSFLPPLYTSEQSSPKKCKECWLHDTDILLVTKNSPLMSCAGSFGSTFDPTRLHVPDCTTCWFT